MANQTCIKVPKYYEQPFVQVDKLPQKVIELHECAAVVESCEYLFTLNFLHLR